MKRSGPRLKMLRPRVATVDTSRIPAPVRDNDRFYQSNEWRALSRKILNERGRRCAQCGATEGRMICDHVIEVNDGGTPLDPDNIQVLCNPCHQRKGAEARRARMAR